jgi:hypothetical protein
VWSYPFPEVDPCVDVDTPGDIHGDGIAEIFSLSDGGVVRCLSAAVPSFAPSFDRQMNLTVESTGQVYAIVFDFNTNASLASEDAVGQVTLQFRHEAGHWISAYVYDYDAAAWQEVATQYLQTY